MNRYIALLRAINVGGYRKIKMDDLREMFSSMGFNNPETYIASGNVVFEAPEEVHERLAGRIKKQIDDTFGHDVPVVIRTAGEMEAVLDRVPFESKEGWRLYITFLPSAPSSDISVELESLSSGIEKFRVLKREVFSFVNKKTSKKPNFSNNFIEKHFDMQGTTRNLRTVRKIQELASARD